MKDSELIRRRDDYLNFEWKTLSNYWGKDIRTESNHNKRLAKRTENSHRIFWGTISLKILLKVKIQQMVKLIGSQG